MKLRLTRLVSVDDYLKIDLSKYIPHVVNSMRKEWSLAGGGTSNLRIRLEEFGHCYGRPTNLLFEMREY